MRLKILSLVVLASVLVYSMPENGSCRTQSNEPAKTGTIKGVVIDGETKSPLIGANVLILDTTMGASTDVDGNFTINSVPVGDYTLRISYIGYEQLSKTDIIVKSSRITFVNAGLKTAVLMTDDVVVTAGYFSKVEDQATSAVNFSSEEIRRAPGSAGDVSRIIMGLPSLAKVNDSMNSLIVRGGSPVENSFYIDNIEIPNINHYPTQGSSGGPIGILNVDFIQDVNFYTGGFSAAYGDKLSSVMDLQFREGNRDEFDAQLDFNMAGFGGIVEGPLFNGKGSGFFSARKSFLDLLIDAIGTGVAPKYSDYQGKIVYDLSQNHKLSVIDILGIDYIGFNKEDAEEMGSSVFGTFDIMENSFGVNLRSLWNKNGFSNTSISHSLTKRTTDQFENMSGRSLIKNLSTEQAFQFRNVNRYRFNESNQIEFGLEAKHIIDDYDYYFAEYNDALGNPTPALSVDDKITAQKYGAFTSYIWRPAAKLTITPGLRYDYFSYNGNNHISPRLTLAYKVTDRTTLSGSAGIFRQNLPLIILGQNDTNKDLKDPWSRHFVLGISRLLSENTKLTLEFYDKKYENFPLDPSTPELFTLDELFYRYGMFFNHENLSDKGEAYTRGLELSIQKKMAVNFYGMISASYFRSRYKDYNDTWRDRVFDNQYTFSMEGGYKPSNKWEFSMR